MGCGSCEKTVRQPAPMELFQIRQGFRAQWHDLALSIETTTGDWTLRVQDSGANRTLYTAHRGGARAAQRAAAEFAIFRELGPESRVSPDRLVSQLSWQAYW